MCAFRTFPRRWAPRATWERKCSKIATRFQTSDGSPSSRTRQGRGSQSSSPWKRSSGRYDHRVRRADRLFRIVQRLRRRGATTAGQLAEALEVSERTIYRDVRDLTLSGVPILGEAGVGYALPRGFDLPPLM